MSHDPGHDIRPPKGVIFDLDGTLVDTVDARIDGWIEALHDAGFEAKRSQIAPMIGMDGRKLARDIAAARGVRLDDERLEEIDRAAGEAFDRRNGEPRPLPGVHAVIAAIEGAGIPWVIATSSRAQQVKGSVAALRLGGDPTIVDGSHVEHAKPEPDLLLLAAERIGVAPEDVWAVGDSTWDMRAAAIGGMQPIGVTAGSAVTAAELRDAGGMLVVRTLEELAQALRSPEEVSG